jgi:transcription elongation GreA/GreB family factor
MTATTQPAVHVGTTVSFTDLTAGTEQQFTIVDPPHAAPADGRLSACSPVAAALLGCHVGDRVEVRTPRGIRPLIIAALS